MESIGHGHLLSGILFSIAAIGYGFVTNPSWPRHARFYAAWQILSQAGIAVIALSHLAERPAARDCEAIEL